MHASHQQPPLSGAPREHVAALTGRVPRHARVPCRSIAAAADKALLHCARRAAAIARLSVAVITGLCLSVPCTSAARCTPSARRAAGLQMPRCCNKTCSPAPPKLSDPRNSPPQRLPCRSLQHPPRKMPQSRKSQRRPRRTRRTEPQQCGQPQGSSATSSPRRFQEPRRTPLRLPTSSWHHGCRCRSGSPPPPQPRSPRDVRRGGRAHRTWGLYF